MPPKQSRTERGKQAILDMVSKIYPEVVDPEVLLYDGTNRNVVLNYVLVMPIGTRIEPNEFMKEFADYFNPYRCVVHSNNPRTQPYILSYVECTSCDVKDDETSSNFGNIVADIEIKYYKDHVPYPDPESIGQLQALLHINEEKLDIAKRENGRLIKKNNSLINKSNQNLANMRKIIATLYESCSNKQNCPACWEEISTEKLRVPGCGHFICVDCKDKLAKPECPMCREPMSRL